MVAAQGTVSGRRDERRVNFYGISTCIWCRRTRQFLEDQEVAFEFAYVDLLQGEEKEQVMVQVRRWNPFTSFPTIVVDDAEVVVGYKPDELKKVLGL